MNIEVKRAFVLADWMKSAKRCRSKEEFCAMLWVETARVEKLSEHGLDEIIVRDQLRLDRFEKLPWRLDIVSISECLVYPRMGERLWAVGTVKEVAERFLHLEPIGSRIWKMKLFAEIFSSNLPLIIIERAGRFDIDDGSHRAVAMQLSGIMKTNAYVGLERKRT
jgi:hypothetical protein